MDIMRQTAMQLQQIVERSVDCLLALTEADSQARRPSGEWSKKEILGHLIDSACNNHQRFVRAQLEAELVFPGYEQEGWARCQGYATADWALLVELWAAYNRHLAAAIARIPAEKLATPCRVGG